MEKILEGRCYVEGKAPTPCKLTFSIDEGSKAAWKWAGVCLAAAVLSLFIPLAHFVLFPSFLIATPMVFIWKKRHRVGLREASIQCPHCSAEYQLQSLSMNFPLEVFCDQCRKAFKLEPTDGKVLASLEHLETQGRS